MTSGTSRETPPPTVMEQCRAVLSVWTEKRTVEQVCRELDLRRPVFMQWQERAMSGMIRALSPREAQEARKPALAVMVRRLVERQAAEAGGPGSRLTRRLAAVSTDRDSPAPAEPAR